MMSRVSLGAALLLAALVPSGCGTVANLQIGARQGWKNAQIYGGVRRDVKSAQEFFADNWTPANNSDVQQDVGAVVGVGLVGMDVPLSAIADTLTLPVTIPAAIWGSSTPSPTVSRKNTSAANPAAPAAADIPK
jgi:uncharacterized protein YceK